MFLKKIIIFKAKLYRKIFSKIFLFYYKIYFRENFSVNLMHFENVGDRHSFIFILKDKNGNHFVYKKLNFFMLIHDKLYLGIDFINDKKLFNYFKELKNHNFCNIPTFFQFKNKVICEYLGDDYQRLDKIIEENNKNISLLSGYKEKIKQLILRLNEIGYIHGDIKAKNIYIRKSDHFIIFIDWDGMRKKEKQPNLDLEKLDIVFQRFI
ncbi:MAG TPA: RIO1 family regulatory kinase/ATPase [bacterium]|jgi:serine/threonine protein kinase|nr:RIO1 family regulatory kinase/ATPase [bacterium]HOG38132.1 RIO1 family regulatory kinase/ATPase [bacterium]